MTEAPEVPAPRKGIMTENTDTEICECKQAHIDIMIAMADMGEPRAEAWLANGGEAAARDRRCDC